MYSYHNEYATQSWIWGYGFVRPTLDCDKALITENPASHYGIATLFDKPIDVTEKDLIVQYEVRFQRGLECGGAYIKLLRNGEIASAEDLTSSTPYVLMFGPDFCGPTNLVQVIIPHYNPVSKEWSEKRLRGGPRIVHDNLTHLYTLIIRRDDSIEILIDQINKFTGDLKTDFDPPFSSPAVLPFSLSLSYFSRPSPTPPTPSLPTGSRTTAFWTPPTSNPPTGTSPNRSSFSTRPRSSLRTGWTTSRWRFRTPR